MYVIMCDFINRFVKCFSTQMFRFFLNDGFLIFSTLIIHVLEPQDRTNRAYIYAEFRLYGDDDGFIKVPEEYLR